MNSQLLEDIVKEYTLLPHPEGGYYKETYRSELKIAPLHDSSLERVSSTGIYFLLSTNDFSAFHKIQSDEMWHYYFGDPLLIHIINPQTRSYECKVLGPPTFTLTPQQKQHFPASILQSMQAQQVVPAECWFASETIGRVYPNSTQFGFTFCGCTVAPGFDWRDFEMATHTSMEHFWTKEQLQIASPILDREKMIQKLQELVR